MCNGETRETQHDLWEDVTSKNEGIFINLCVRKNELPFNSNKSMEFPSTCDRGETKWTRGKY
jgi:hypothetical protein